MKRYQRTAFPAHEANYIGMKMVGIFILWMVIAAIFAFIGGKYGLKKARKYIAEIPEVNKGINVVEYEVYRFNKSLKEESTKS